MQAQSSQQYAQQRQNYMREQHGLTPTELVGYELSPLRNRATKAGMRSLPRQHTPLANRGKQSLNTIFNGNSNSNKTNNTGVVGGSVTPQVTIPLYQSSVMKSLKRIPSEKSTEDNSPSGQDQKLSNSKLMGMLTASNPQLIRIGGNPNKDTQSNSNVPGGSPIRSQQQSSQTLKSQQQQAQHLRSSSTGNFKKVANKPIGEAKLGDYYNGEGSNIKALLEQQLQKQDQQYLKQQQQYNQKYQPQPLTQLQQQQQMQYQFLNEVQGISSKHDINDVSSDNEDEFNHQVWDNSLLQVRGIDCERWITSDNKPFTLFHLYKARFGTFPTQRESIPNSQVVTMMKRFSRNKRNKNLERFPWESFDDSRQYEDETDLFTDKNFIMYSKYCQGYQQLKSNKAQPRNQPAGGANTSQVDNESKQVQLSEDNSGFLGQSEVILQSQQSARNPQVMHQKQARSVSQASSSTNNVYSSNTVNSGSMTMTNLIALQQQQSKLQQQQQQEFSNDSQQQQQFRIRQLSNSNHVSSSSQLQQQYQNDINSNSPLKIEQSKISKPNQPISPSKRMLSYHYQSPMVNPASQPIFPTTNSPIRVQRTPKPANFQNQESQQLQDTQSFSQMVESYSHNSSSPNQSPVSSRQPSARQTQQSQQYSPLHGSQLSQSQAPSFKLQLINAMRSPGEKNSNNININPESQPFKETQYDADSSPLRKAYYSNANGSNIPPNIPLGLTSQPIQLYSKKLNGDSPTSRLQQLQNPLRVGSISPQKNKSSANNNNNTSDVNASTSSNANDGTGKNQANPNSILHLKNLHQQSHQPSPFNNELTQNKKINILQLLKQ